MWYLLKFFTTWSIILSFAHRYTNRFVNVVYMTYLVSVMGLYFSFINPRKFVVYTNGGKKVVFTGWQKFLIIDLVFHIGVFVIMLYIYGNTKYSVASYINVVLFMLLYLVCIEDLKKVYGVRIWEMLIVFIIAHSLFFLFFLK